MMSFMFIKPNTTVGTMENKMECSGAFRNPDGRDTRSDKQIKTYLKEQNKKR